MSDRRPAAEVEFQVEFYDVDSMKVAWHGHYVKFMELGRRALLDEIGFGYARMAETGYVWPVVDMRVKYVRPLFFGQKATVRAVLDEYENRLKIKFEIFCCESGEKVTIAETVQMAVEEDTGESLFVSPDCLIQAVENYMKGGS